MDIEIQGSKIYHDSKRDAEKSINNCFFPNCTNKSINSHILQKNGILSNLEENRHVMRLELNRFKKQKLYFKRVGINEAFSFNCFCNKHDTELFHSIEVKEIDFSIYKNRLLFTLRTVLNEKYRKMVNCFIWSNFIDNHSKIFDANMYRQLRQQEELGLKDLEKMENIIWSDIFNNTESYVFNIREISEKPICLSSFYTYETSSELLEYRKAFGKDKDRTTDIFVCLFPHKSKSIFIMGYEKQHESVVKSYINVFFKENEKRLERRISNLMLFLCETWVISEKFYIERIRKCENSFEEAIDFSQNNSHERRFFDINLFQPKFCEQMHQWKKNVA